MRYHESDYQKPSTDGLSFFRNMVVLVFLAPYRLIGEISQKLMYLPKKSLEQLSLVALSLSTVLLLWDCVQFVLTKDADLLKGASPIFVKFVVILLLGWASWSVIGKVSETDFLLKNLLEDATEEEDEDSESETLEEIAEDEIAAEESEGKSDSVVETPTVAAATVQSEPEPSVKHVQAEMLEWAQQLALEKTPEPVSETSYVSDEKEENFVVDDNFVFATEPSTSEYIQAMTASENALKRTLGTNMDGGLSEELLRQFAELEL